VIFFFLLDARHCSFYSIGTGYFCTQRKLLELCYLEVVGSFQVLLFSFVRQDQSSMSPKVQCALLVKPSLVPTPASAL
jgi:hypothetical protein